MGEQAAARPFGRVPVARRVTSIVGSDQRPEPIDRRSAPIRRGKRCPPALLGHDGDEPRTVSTRSDYEKYWSMTASRSIFRTRPDTGTSLIDSQKAYALGRISREMVLLARQCSSSDSLNALRFRS